MEGIGAQDDAPNGGLVGIGPGRILVAMPAMGALHRGSLDRKRGMLEIAIGDDGRPPAGDGVAPQLEHRAMLAEDLRAHGRA